MEPRIRHFTLASLAIGVASGGLALVLAACSSDDSTSFTPDDGDSSTPAHDAGHPTPDASDATSPVPDAAPPADAHVSDANVHDAHVADANAPDSHVPDANVPDVDVPDASTPDTGTPDADLGDVSVPDGDVPDGDVTDGSDAATTTTDGSLVPTDAIGAWTFDEGTGTTSADLSGHAHPATLMGTATWATGKSGTGLSLDGAAGFADVGASLLDTTKSFSVVCWLQLGAATGWQSVISQEGTTLSVFTLKRRDDNAKFDFDFPGDDSANPATFTVAQSTTAPAAATWYHVAGVYDVTGGKVRIYVNGALEDAQPPGTILAGAGHTIIGRSRWAGANASFVNGVIDDVQIFARALNDGEVAAIYGATK